MPFDKKIAERTSKASKRSRKTFGGQKQKNHNQPKPKKPKSEPLRASQPTQANATSAISLLFIWLVHVTKKLVGDSHS